MAFVKISAGHQSPQSSLPPLSQKQISTGTWGTGGNTCLITDEYIHTNSVVHAYVTGTTPPVGNWSFTTANGTCTITSTDAESSSLPVSYVIF